MARYGQRFKDRAVARLLPPESAAVEKVSNELGVSVATLERWRADALAESGGGSGKRVWTAVARLDAVTVTAGMDEVQRGAWCREKGLYPVELEKWRESAVAALASPEEAGASPGETRRARARIRDLEREVKRKDRALAETAALLVLSKKLSAIFEEGADA